MKFVVVCLQCQHPAVYPHTPSQSAPRQQWWHKVSGPKQCLYPCVSVLVLTAGSVSVKLAKSCRYFARHGNANQHSAFSDCAVCVCFLWFPLCAYVCLLKFCSSLCASVFVSFCWPAAAPLGHRPPPALQQPKRRDGWPSAVALSSAATEGDRKERKKRILNSACYYEVNLTDYPDSKTTLFMYRRGRSPLLLVSEELCLDQQEVKCLALGHLNSSYCSCGDCC